MKAATRKAKKKIISTKPQTTMKRKGAKKSKIDTQNKKEYDDILKRIKNDVKATKKSNGRRKLYNINGDLFTEDKPSENNLNRLNAEYKALVPKKLSVVVDRLDALTISMLTQMV